MTNCIEIKGLCKSYPDFSLQNIDLTLPGGTIMGLIGENGAGKTRPGGAGGLLSDLLPGHRAEGVLTMNARRRLLWLGQLTAAGAALLPFTGTVRPGGPLSCCLLALAVVLLLLGGGE